MSSKTYKKRKSIKSSAFHKKCSGWCWPTLIYVALSLLGLVVILSGQSPQIRFESNEDRNKYYMTQIFSQLIWVVILYALCSKCKSNIAWFVLFLPVIMMFFVGVLVLALLGTTSLSMTTSST